MAGPPYYFADLNGNRAMKGPSDYVVAGRISRFPSSHRLAGDQTISTMEPMRQDLFRLFVRLECDADAFRSFLSHGIQDLLLPFSSVHVRTHAVWLIPKNGELHAGSDFKDAPLNHHPYSDHRARTFFDVLSVGDGTIVGWDENKLLTVEHVSCCGKLYRIFYNMMKDAPVAAASGNILTLGGAVTAGQVLGRAWNPDGRSLDNIHLHFGMSLRQTVPAGWSPNFDPLFTQLAEGFGVTFSAAQRVAILENLGSLPWKRSEWFCIEPFGRYDTFSEGNATYGPLSHGFYYPVPNGLHTYSFRDAQIAGDPGGERIPLFAGSRALLDNVSVGPLSMATLSAVSE